MANTPYPFTFPLSDAVQHVFIVGSSGKGRSRRLEAEAERLGISLEELERRLEPSEEQKATHRQAAESARQRDAVRLQAVRDAWWAASVGMPNELNELHDVLSVQCECENPTDAQLKAVFDLLPAECIGDIISWGLGDTEVRDQVWVFATENADIVRAAIKAATP